MAARASAPSRPPHADESRETLPRRSWSSRRDAILHLPSHHDLTEPYPRRATRTTVWWVISSRSPSRRTCNPAGSPSAVSRVRIMRAVGSSTPAARSQSSTSIASAYRACASTISPMSWSAATSCDVAVDVRLARGAEFLQAILIGALLGVLRAHAVDEDHTRLGCGHADHLR